MTNSFTFENFSDFDSHINQSIPTLSELDGLVERLAYDFAQEGTYVTDLGCSTGRVLNNVPKRPNVKYLGIDKDMEPQGEDAHVEFVKGDLVTHKFPQSSVVISMFTLQFVPTYLRGFVLDKIHKSMVSGGILILAEKTHANDSRLDSVFQAALMEHKTKYFTSDEIVTKQIGLSPVMHLRTEDEMYESLHMFDSVDTAWTWGGFRMVVAQRK